MGGQCSCASAVAVGDSDACTEAAEQQPVVGEDRVGEDELVVEPGGIAADVRMMHAPAAEHEGEEQSQDPAVPPKPRATRRSAGSGRGRRRPTWCAPEAVIGEWRTHVGFYEIFLNERSELSFQENHLHGVLRLEGEWYTAEIRDSSTEEDTVFGYLRLHRQGEVIRSQFKPSSEDSWENLKTRDAKRLPYLHIGTTAAAKATIDGAARLWEQSTCCICFEILEDGEDFAELECHHVFHKSCIRSWFQRSGNCPMRCGCEAQRS